MATSRFISRQQLAGWILISFPAALVAVALFHFQDTCGTIASLFSSSFAESLTVLFPAGINIGVLLLSIGLIRNDSDCRPALMVYSALFTLVGIAVPIFGLLQPPADRKLNLFVPIEHPAAIHYALFFLFFFVLFGIPLWLMLRKPAAPLLASLRPSVA